MGPVSKKRFIVLFLSISALALAYNAFFMYDQWRRINETRILVSRNQAKALNDFLIAFRRIYQKVIIDNHIPIDRQTVELLPVKTTPKIAHLFSIYTANDAIIHTVSDRPRNPNNRADALEMESIRYFKQHPDAAELYRIIQRGDKEYFYYATPLYVTQQCLTCHGPRAKAPEYIKTNYERAYDYHLGDLRGIIAIYLSQKALTENITPVVYRNVIVTLTITLLFLAIFYFILKKFYGREIQYTKKLEEEVKKKTQAIQRQSQELEYRLFHDPLTHLPNRNGLINDLATRDPKAILLVNIDDFNEINDFYGHTVGDELLKEMARLLSTRCNIPNCSLYRMPTDEFALLFYDDLSESSLESLIHSLLQSVNRHDFAVDVSNVIHLRVAIGASRHKDELLITADMAMKKAKAERLDYVLYDHSIDLGRRYKQNLDWAERLKWAIENDGIVPYYQPIVDARDGGVKAYEALIRLVDANGTVHTPYQFLEIAKRTKYYPELTKRMADKVFERFQTLDYHFSLNISYLDVVNKETMAYLIDKIDRFPDPGRIHFEILESEGIERYEEVMTCFKRLKKLGCHISLDDFGSGYSNFEHILKLDVDMLKIDGSLIRNIDRDIGSQIIVETIVDFAHKLGIDTCAEFVASEEIYETVKEMGVTYVQGYYFGEPSKDLKGM